MRSGRFQQQLKPLPHDLPGLLQMLQQLIAQALLLLLMLLLLLPSAVAVEQPLAARRSTCLQPFRWCRCS